jgi:fructose/tagatose bisphosphate aldolase
MEDFTQIRVELDVQAQRLISQYMIDNERISKQVEIGVKRAFEKIDLEKEVENSVMGAIQRAIKESSEWGKIREAVKKKTDEIVESYIEKAIQGFKSDFEGK